VVPSLLSSASVDTWQLTQTMTVSSSRKVRRCMEPGKGLSRSARVVKHTSGASVIACAGCPAYSDHCGFVVLSCSEDATSLVPSRICSFVLYELQLTGLSVSIIFAEIKKPPILSRTSGSRKHRTHGDTGRASRAG